MQVNVSDNDRPLILVPAKTHLVDTLATDEHGAEIARVAAPEQPKLAVHARETKAALRHGGWQTLGK